MRSKSLKLKSISPQKQDRNSMRKRQMIRVLKWVIYIVLMMITFVIMGTPGLMLVNGWKPLLLIPLTVSVAMFEGELAGGIYAIVSGIFWGTVSDTFLGFHALFLYILCVSCGLMIKFYFKSHVLSALMLSGVSTVIFCLADFFFNYAMWGYVGREALFIKQYIPIMVYTILVSPVFYFLVKLVHTKVRAKQADEIFEEA